MSVLPVANDKVQLTSSAGTNYQNGVLMSGASAVYAISSPSVWSNGIYRTADGAIYVFNATAGMPLGFTWSNGLPFSALGALCVSTNAVASWSNGIPFDANGAVVADFNIPAPALNLDFTSGILDSRITFTRTSGATYTDSTGVLRTTANNLSLWSQTFQNAFWDKGLTTVVDNSTIAPDGTQTAALFSEAAGTGSHHIHDLTGNFTPTVASSYCMSIYVKQPPTAADRYLQLAFWTAGFGANAYLNFDLQTKTTAAIGSAITSSGVEVLSAGWMRIWAVAPATVAAASGFQLVFVSSGTAVRAESYTVTAGSEESTYIWGAQVAQSAVLTPYVRNEGTASGAPRFDYDPVTLTAKGLLIEEQRTNLLTYSEQFDNAAWVKGSANVTANVTAAPDGTFTADKIVENSISSVQHFMYQTYAGFTAGRLYTFTCYLKAVERTDVKLQFNNAAFGVFVQYRFTLVGSGSVTEILAGTNSRGTISSVGGGWYRCSISAQATATIASQAVLMLFNELNSDTYVGNGTSGACVWGAQLEEGSFATSYIPTTSAQATRAADVAVISGANFSSWYNQSEGAIFVEADVMSSRETGLLSAQNSPLTNNFMRFTTEPTTMVGRFYVESGGATQANMLSSVSTSIGATFKQVASYKLNDFAHTMNGASVGTDTSGTVPSSIAELRIGSGGYATTPSAHIKALAYYNTRLSNTQLQTLTT